MKVLFLDYSSFFGGAEQSLVSLLPLLGKDIEPVLVLSEDSQWASVARDAGIDCRRIMIGNRLSAVSQRKALSGALHPGLWTELRRAQEQFRVLCLRERPEVIYANTFKAAVFTGLYRGGGHRALVWHVRDIVGGSSGRLWQSLGSLRRPKVVAVSKAAARQPALSWPGSDPAVVYNGIDCGQWCHLGREQGIQEIRARIGVAPGEKLLAAFGQLAPWKGQEHSLAALAALRKKGVLCQLALVGDAVFTDRSYPRKLKHMAEKLGIENSVKFCGWVKNPAPYMAAADIIVHTPVKPEPFGRAVVEAMCLGKPVVAFGVGALPEIIENGRSGFLCRPEELQLVLEKLIYDPGRARTVGEAGGRRAREHFSLEQTARGVQKILTEI